MCALTGSIVWFPTNVCSWTCSPTCSSEKAYNTFKGFLCIWGQSLYIKPCFLPGISNITWMARGKVNISLSHVSHISQIPPANPRHKVKEWFFPMCFPGPKHFPHELAQLGTLVMVTWEKRYTWSLTGNDANRINEARFFLLQEGRQR